MSRNSPENNQIKVIKLGQSNTIALKTTEYRTTIIAIRVDENGSKFLSKLIIRPRANTISRFKNRG